VSETEDQSNGKARERDDRRVPSLYPDTMNEHFPTKSVFSTTYLSLAFPSEGHFLINSILLAESHCDGTNPRVHNSAGHASLEARLVIEHFDAMIDKRA
ncbi:hypothetical protein Tco_1230857, partial [Tanacetum coccineum]